MNGPQSMMDDRELDSQYKRVMGTQAPNQSYEAAQLSISKLQETYAEIKQRIANANVSKLQGLDRVQYHVRRVAGNAGRAEEFAQDRVENHLLTLKTQARKTLDTVVASIDTTRQLSSKEREHLSQLAGLCGRYAAKMDEYELQLVAHEEERTVLEEKAASGDADAGLQLDALDNASTAYERGIDKCTVRCTEINSTMAEREAEFDGYGLQLDVLGNLKHHAKSAYMAAAAEHTKARINGKNGTNLQSVLTNLDQVFQGLQQYRPTSKEQILIETAVGKLRPDGELECAGAELDEIKSNVARVMQKLRSTRFRRPYSGKPGSGSGLGVAG